MTESTNHDLLVVLSDISASLKSIDRSIAHELGGVLDISASLRSIDKTLAHELGGDLGNLRRISRMLSGIDFNTHGIKHELEEFNAFNTRTR
jgi:hypothetical protein